MDNFDEANDDSFTRQLSDRFEGVESIQMRFGELELFMESMREFAKLDSEGILYG